MVWTFAIGDRPYAPCCVASPDRHRPPSLVIAPLLGLLADPRMAKAALDPVTIVPLLVPCGISLGAGKIPFICFDLAGGGNIAGSNVLVGGPKGQTDFYRSPATASLDFPAPWCRVPAPPEISSTAPSGCGITRTAHTSAV